MWCHIVICKGITKSGESCTFLYKMQGSEWLSCSALLHMINIPPALWCIARCTQYFDTKLHGILPWADINRNGNIFFLVRSWFPQTLLKMLLSLKTIGENNKIMSTLVLTLTYYNIHCSHSISPVINSLQRDTNPNNGVWSVSQTVKSKVNFF